MTLDAAVMRARKKKGLRLRDLEKRCGVSLSVLSRIENDQIDPTFRKVAAIAKALGISLERLARTYDPEVA